MYIMCIILWDYRYIIQNCFYDNIIIIWKHMESVNTDKSSGIEVEGYCFINVQFERIP